MKTVTMLFIVFVIGSSVTFSQTSVEWESDFGSSGDDVAESIIQTDDGGFAVAGSAHVANGDVSDNNGGLDYWLVKLDEDGKLEWEANFGGSEDDVAKSVIQTDDGGYLLSGYTESSDGDLNGNNGDQDAWMVKVSDAGSMEWEEHYGGTGRERANEVIQNDDGDYIVAGTSQFADGDVGESHGRNDFWILSLTSNGSINWEKSYGEDQVDMANDIKQTEDGGYIVAGSYHNSVGVVKLDEAGNLAWDTSYGGSGIDFANAVIETSDGNFYVACSSNSDDGDVSDNNGRSDYWILKLDETGNLEQEMNFGGGNHEYPHSIIETSDDHLIIAGETWTEDASGDLSEEIEGTMSFWVVKMDKEGSLIWEDHVPDSEIKASIVQTGDHEYVVAGATSKLGGFTSTDDDFFIVKLKESTTTGITSTESYNEYWEVYPQPATESLKLQNKSQQAENIQITLMTISGRNVLSRDVQATQQGQTIQLDTRQLPTGTYLLQTKEEGKMPNVQKVILK